MAKKYEIFGLSFTRFEWFDIKTKFKQTLRKITYSRLFQELICIIITGYMKLVYFTSRRLFVNYGVAADSTKAGETIILCFWHNRLMMIPFFARKIKKNSLRQVADFNFMTLASKHGDGKFVGRVMEKFGFISILGSTKDGRKSSRGIDLSSLRMIFSGLKKGFFLGITPDGPRGPNQKINGEVVNIARISGAKLMPVSYSTSRFIELRSWDRFKIPLPFSTICFYCDENLIAVPKEAQEIEMDQIKEFLTERMNLVQEKSLETALKNGRRN